MSGGGGKGGSTETSIDIDPRLEELGVATGVGALKTAALPFRPTRGVQVAGFTPQQNAAMEGAATAASAFGLPSAGPANMPEMEANSMGILGYDPSYLYDDMVARSFTPEDLAARDEISQFYGERADKIANMNRKIKKSGGGGGK